MRSWSAILATASLTALFYSTPCSAEITNRTATSKSRPAHWAIQLEKPGVPNCHQITTNLFRSAQPTVQGMAELKSMGIKMIVNLRHFHSDHEKLAGIDLKQSRLQMDPWRAKDDDVVRFLKLAADTNNFPMLVHCQRGADRTGLVCAMYRIVLCDWTKEQAIEELKEGGFGFNPTWKNIVRYIERVDIEQIKTRAGLIPTVGRERSAVVMPVKAPEKIGSGE
jgi:protein tyrosine phosphatase (PTP) superfamily phosphohydrolase (DUF442 family)